jgi:hypothetical protein
LQEEKDYSTWTVDRVVKWAREEAKLEERYLQLLRKEELTGYLGRSTVRILRKLDIPVKAYLYRPLPLLAADERRFGDVVLSREESLRLAEETATAVLCVTLVW